MRTELSFDRVKEDVLGSKAVKSAAKLVGTGMLITLAAGCRTQEVLPTLAQLASETPAPLATATNATVDAQVEKLFNDATATRQSEETSIAEDITRTHLSNIANTRTAEAYFTQTALAERQNLINTALASTHTLVSATEAPSATLTPVPTTTPDLAPLFDGTPRKENENATSTAQVIQVTDSLATETARVQTTEPTTNFQATIDHLQKEMDATGTAIAATDTPTMTLTKTPSATNTPLPTETLEPTDTPSVTLAPTNTPLPTETSVPTSTSTNTITPSPVATDTLAPTNTLTFTSTPEPIDTPNPNTQAESHSPHLLLGINRDGYTEVNVPFFREYFRGIVSLQGKDATGNTIDFIASALGTSDNDRNLILSHALNFWFTNLQGLGWSGQEMIYSDRETDIRGNMFDTSGNLLNIFTVGADGKMRYVEIDQALDFENVLAKAAINRFLIGAGMLGKNRTEVEAYLNQPEIDAKIHALVSTLISTNGVEQRSQDISDPDPIVGWPGAANFINSDYNFFSDGFHICIAKMAPAVDRNSQRETSLEVNYQYGVENANEGNDEIVNLSDSRGDAIIAITFDPEAPATANGALTPDGKGTMRADIFRVSSIEDPLFRQQLANQTGKEVFYLPPNDTEEGVFVFWDGNRWIPCGVPVKVQPTQVIAQPVPTNIPGNPNTPVINTPNIPSNTPPVITNTPAWPTEMPTNQDLFTQVPTTEATTNQDDIPPTNFLG